MSENKKNIYEKLGDVIVELQNSNLKKSGKNKFSNYNYFELSDFLPKINELNQKNRIKSFITFVDDSVILTIVDIDNIDSKIEFKSKIANCNLKGAQEIQNLGSVHTYMRRYMYVIAYEIVEHDVIDSMSHDIQQPKIDKNEIAKRFIMSLPQDLKKNAEILFKSDKIKYSFINLSKMIKSTANALELLVIEVTKLKQLDINDTNIPF